jgi:hypothetical protein
MSKMKELNEIAQGIADVTLELMYDSVDWQLSEYEADSDDYVAIHAETLQRAVEIMYHQTRKM